MWSITLAPAFLLIEEVAERAEVYIMDYIPPPSPSPLPGGWHRNTSIYTASKRNQVSYGTLRGSIFTDNLTLNMAMRSNDMDNTSDTTRNLYDAFEFTSSPLKQP